LSKPRAEFYWPRDDQSDVNVSPDHVAIHNDCSKASIERITDGPPWFYIGRLKRSSAHAWNAYFRRKLEEAMAAKAAAAAPALPAPNEMLGHNGGPKLDEPIPAPLKGGRGRPRKVKVAAPAMTSPSPAVEPAPGRRKRGRPRKCVAPPELSASE
jgi:hypothetical protein